MSVAVSVRQIAVPFTWAGAVGSISFIEAPLKFRAPGMTVPLALGIGRLVFPALNKLELGLAALLVAAALGQDPGPGSWALITLPTIILLSQMIWLRPRLDVRAGAVIRGTVSGRASRLHLAYVGLETAKLVLLVTAGAALGESLLP